MMRSRDPMGDTQTESGTGYLALYGRASIKSLKYTVLLCKRYGSTMVSNFQSNAVIARHHLDGNGCVGRRILQRIVDELLDGQLHQVPIDCDRRQWLLAGYSNFAIVYSGAHGGDYFANNLADI